VTDRRFLLLQGPHGPFFYRLGRLLVAAGANVWRVGFTGGDRAFWPRKADYIAYTGTEDDWPETFGRLVAEKGITDVVVYGDTRPVHASAISIARAAGVTVHVFEEGYLRPYWITYERGGSNGHSRLLTIDLPSMRQALENRDGEQAEAPASWGDLRQHVFYGALYHGFVLFGARTYRAYRPHRAISVAAEFRLHLKRLVLMPWHRFERALATRRIERGSFPYYLVLLQLDHDASFRAHGPYRDTTEFVSQCIEAFAGSAPRHHRLVFKAHPLEDDRVPLAPEILRLARKFDIADRVHFLRGGKLARVLSGAKAAVTVNSTAGQQALWRGLPLRAFGTAIYGKPGLVSDQPLAEFFSDPQRPDLQAYRDFRQFLLETSQVPGGFYSARGRAQALRRVIDMMLAPCDPYDAVLLASAAPRQQLRVVT
jgi:capsular polysaccharide export protein